MCSLFSSESQHVDYTDTDLPLEQMPIWFTTTLSHHNHMYNTVLLASLEHNNWGVSAGIIRYRNCEDQISIWEACVKEATQCMERAREECTQACYRLEAVCAHQHFVHLDRDPEGKTSDMTTILTWSSPSLSWGDAGTAGGTSEVEDNLKPRRGMVKLAGTSGFGPGTVRGYDEPA
jgi:hypothetical protein